MSSVTAGAAHPAKKSWWWDLLTTVDHKKIGLMYLITAFVFFAIAGVGGLLIRLQLSQPDMDVLVGRFYNQILTMHGSTMQFLFIIPIAAAFGNYFLPLMIGARDMAMPRMNAFAYWLYLLGGLLMHAAPLFGGWAEGGWVAYFPFSSSTYQPGAGLDTWILGLQLVGFSSILGGVNIIATTVNLRAPGLGWRQLPMFAWAMLATSFLQVLATPGVTAATVLTYLDRTVGISLFNPAIGGDPVLYQHLFWFYSHPAVYIMVLPWFGIVSEILPTFSRKPIFGYPALAGATMGIALVSFLVWAHHMFTSMGSPLLNSIFAFTTMLVAVPTGIKIFNWLATVWRGKITFNTSMLMTLGFIFLFTIGGITGVSLALVPFNWQMHDSYFVVAHFHNILVGGSLFVIMAGIFYWFPKMTGRYLNERLGKILFALWGVGYMVTYFPQYVLGMLGMPRRIYTYQEGIGWEIWNAISSLGSLMLAVGFLLFVYNVIISLRGPKTAGADPWDGYTLEWASESPPEPHNFSFDFPTDYQSERPLYHWKKDGTWPPKQETRLRVSEIHLPMPSIWPFATAAGLTLMLTGLVLQGPLWVAGLVLSLAAMIVWSRERAFESDEIELEVQHHNRTQTNNGMMFTYWFLASEAALFLMMFSAFFYLLFTGRMVFPEELPSWRLALVNTLFLVSSSFTVHYAHHGLLHNRRGRFLALLGITIGLGGLFLGVTGFEWSEVLMHFDPRENLYLSVFFSITGLHGLHVIIGLVMLSLALVRALVGDFTPRLHNGVEVPVAYWHLVDVVWIFVLCIIYVMPNFYQGPERVAQPTDPFAVYREEIVTPSGQGLPSLPESTTPVVPSLHDLPDDAPAEPEGDRGAPTPQLAGLIGEADTSTGAQVYSANCAACHQAQGQGLPGAFPALQDHAAVIASAEGGRDYLKRLLLYGLQGSIEVEGTGYNGVMPAWSQLSDVQLAGVLNYVLTSWGNEAQLPSGFEAYTPQAIAEVRGEGLSPRDVYELRQSLDIRD